MPLDIILRDVIAADLPVFFEQQRDAEANYMAAFSSRDPTDRETFMAHWSRIRRDQTITIKTIVFGGEIAGNIVSFEELGEREVGYWLGERFWGKGIATAALAAFLEIITIRPLYARVAADNIGSRRVLEKCGFVVIGQEQSFAHARGQEITELVLKLSVDKPDPIHRALT